MPGQGPSVRVPVSKKQGGEVRISAKVKRALEAMVLHGKNREQAAEEAGLKEDSLYRALKLPKVLAYRHELMRHLLGNEAARAPKRIGELADSSHSDHVKLEANKFLLGVEGIRPSEHVVHSHTHRIVPGYVLDLSGPDLRKPDWMIEGKARDVTPAADDGPVLEHDEGQPSS